MAGCTVLNTTYGYWAGNSGTDSTSITTDMVQVKGIHCCFTASAHTATFTDKDGVAIGVVTSTPSEFNISIPTYDRRFNGLMVALSNTTARVLVFT